MTTNALPIRMANAKSDGLRSRRPRVNRTHWTNDGIQRACADMMRGYMAAGVDLGASMMLEPRFHAAVNKRVNGILRAKLTVQFPEDATPEELEAVPTIEDDFELMLSEEEFAPWCVSRILYGLAPAVCVPEYHPDDPTRLLYPIRCLNTAECRYEAPLKTKGNKKKPDFDDYDWYYRPQFLTTLEPYLIEPGELVKAEGTTNVWLFARTWNLMYPTGAVSALAVQWARAMWAGRAEDDQNNKAAKSILLGTVPNQADDDRMYAFAEQLIDPLDGAVVVKKEGYEVGFITPSVNGDTTGARAVQEDFARACGVVLNGGNLSSENDGSGGSYAQADVHKTEGELLVDGDIEFISNVISEQLVPHYMAANFPGLRNPIVTWTRAPREDLEQYRSNLELALSTPGVRVKDLPAAFARLGIEVEQDIVNEQRPTVVRPDGVIEESEDERRPEEDTRQPPRFEA